MKTRKIISVLAAAAITMTSTVTSFASGFMSSMTASETNRDAIDIIYNGQRMTYTDAVPEIINDRTMLPFRIALESMGATVDYEDATRLVTASLNGKTITFTLEDTVIYIDENGQKSQITLDVPMLIKNDRTLVPIRFISSALGMQVGWDGETKTVLIVDADTYIKEFEKNTNLMTLAEKTMPKYNTSTAEMSLKLDAEENGEKINASFSLSGDAAMTDAASNANCKLSLDLGGIAGVAEPIKDASVEMILTSDKIYFKTDVIEQLAKMLNGNEALALAAKTLNGSDWYYVEIDALLDKLFADVNTVELYKQILNGNTASISKSDLTDVIKSMLVTDGDATADSAFMADMIIDMYSALDKYITVTDNSVSVKVDKNAFAEIIKSTGVSEADLQEILNAMTFDMDISTTFDEKQAVSKGTMNMGITLGDDKMNMSFDISSTDKVEDSVSPIEIPANAVNIMALAK